MTSALTLAMTSAMTSAMAGAIAPKTAPYITAATSPAPTLGDRFGPLHGKASSVEKAAKCLPCCGAGETSLSSMSPQSTQRSRRDSTLPLPSQLGRQHSTWPFPTKSCRRDARRIQTPRTVVSAGARGREQGWGPLGGRAERRVAPVWRLPILTLTLDKNQIDPQQVHQLMLLTGHSPYAFTPSTAGDQKRDGHVDDALPLAQGSQSCAVNPDSTGSFVDSAFNSAHLAVLQRHASSGGHVISTQGWRDEAHESTLGAEQSLPASARESRPLGWMGSLPSTFQAPPLFTAAELSQAQHHQQQQQRDQQEQQREQEQQQQKQQQQLTHPLPDVSSGGLRQPAGHLPLSISKLRKALKHSTVVVGLQVKLKSLDWDYMKDAPRENRESSSSASNNPNAMRLVAFVRASSDASLTASVHDLVVHPDFQGYGLGQRIMQRMVRELQRFGIGDIALLCQPNLSPYFKTLGFASDRMKTTTMMYTQGPWASSLHTVNTSCNQEEAPQSQEPWAFLRHTVTTSHNEEEAPQPRTEEAVAEEQSSTSTGDGDLPVMGKSGQAVQAALKLSSGLQPHGRMGLSNGAVQAHGSSMGREQEQFVVWGSKLLRVRSGPLLPRAKVESLEELLRNLSPEDEGNITATETKRKRALLLSFAQS